MIERSERLHVITTAIARSPITAMLGPRQCGKTTLAREIANSTPSHYFDLESTIDQQRLENPELALGSLTGLVILDEVQRQPALFNLLRVLADRPNSSSRFLLLGSASPDIIRGVSESLAGRVEFVDISGFSIEEVPDQLKLWQRGGFPRSYLAKSQRDSLAWREGFIRTFLERDIPVLGLQIPPTAMRRFWTMLAHFHGQIWNASELSRSMAMSDKTVRRYLDILSSTFMIRQLQPWHENLRKRQVRSPKVYFRDSGLLHSLLNIPDHHSLLGNPRLGASWEGFALEQVLHGLKPVDCYFWSTHSGAELDLLVFINGKRYGFEFKYADAPKITRSVHIAVQDLSLDHLWVVYPGTHAWKVDSNISVQPLESCCHTVLQKQ